MIAALVFCAGVAAAAFATPGGAEPAGLDGVIRALDADAADMELMVSFGTSKGGSAGHLALAIRDDAGNMIVRSANFYADRDPRHARDFHTAELMVRVPKWEYLYGTRSTLGPKASFGLDFGEVYKRSVVGVRVFAVPAAERAAIAGYLDRMNDDFARRARDTEYQRGEVKYGYMDLNCAKTIASAFKYGAGYDAVTIKVPPALAARKAAAALNANIPAEMTMQLVRELDRRGYAMDVVLYRKYAASPYVDPHDAKAIAFRALPNRFPSMISLDFRNDERAYEDYDNLHAMYLLRNMVRYAVAIDAETQEVSIERAKTLPMAYAQAEAKAAADAEVDSKGFMRRLLSRPRGERIGG